VIVLGIETSATRGGVALVRDGEILAERAFEEGLVHGREVTPAIKDITEASGIPLDQVDLFAVDIGPGSYTGVRVGVATAKAFAWALGKKLAAVCSLDALAEAAKDLGKTIVPVLDARRGQLYTATYRNDSGSLTRINGPAVTEAAGLLNTIPHPAVLLGDAISRFPDELIAGEGITHAPQELWIPAAPVIAELGLRAAQRGELADPVMLEPLYLRPSEAEQKLGVRVDPASTEPEQRT
jgi:tRNA threonylcarbamoyladenosine biosynthesis protein TsaB